MTRRTLAALVLATMGIGLLAVNHSQPVYADPNERISNISVDTIGGVVNYDICVLSSSPPTGAIVQVGGQQGTATFGGQSCGAGTYFIRVTVPGLQAGNSYQFQNADVFLADGNLAPVSHDGGLISNISGDTVGKDCQVDFTFDPTTPLAPQNCSGPGVAGDVRSPVTIPPTNTPTRTPTNTATATPTNTPTSTSTNTPIPSATNTPVPSATSGGTGSQPSSTPTGTTTGSGGITGGNTPTATTGAVVAIETVPPTATTSHTQIQQSSVPQATAIVGDNTGNTQATSNSAPPQTASTPVTLLGTGSTTKQSPTTTGKSSGAKGVQGPQLHVTMLSPLVHPATTQHIAISYAEAALVQARVAFPGRSSQASYYGLTDSHGHLTLSVPVPATVKLQRGRATAPVTVQAVAGPLRRIAALTSTIRTGTTTSVHATTAPNSLVRALVTLPGQKPATIISSSDGHGAVVLHIVTPRNLKLHNGRGVAQVSLWAVTAERHAEVKTTLSISDMVVIAKVSPIVNCLQTQAIQIAYRAHAPLQIAVQFPGGYHVTLTAHADNHGNATAKVSVTYAQAISPLRVGVQVTDMTPRVQRAERIAFSVLLPQACRKSQDASVTVR